MNPDFLTALTAALRGNDPAQQPLMLAQATGGGAGTQRHRIETDPELYGPREAPPPPGGGGSNYQGGSDYKAPRTLTPKELEERHRRIMREAERERLRKTPK